MGHAPCCHTRNRKKIIIKYRRLIGSVAVEVQSLGPFPSCGRSRGVMVTWDVTSVFALDIILGQYLVCW